MKFHDIGSLHKKLQLLQRFKKLYPDLFKHVIEHDCGEWTLSREHNHKFEEIDLFLQEGYQCKITPVLNIQIDDCFYEILGEEEIIIGNFVGIGKLNLKPYHQFLKKDGFSDKFIRKVDEEVAKEILNKALVVNKKFLNDRVKTFLSLG